MINKTTGTRKYLSILDIQKEYLPISKKKIREFVKKYLNIKVIGGRIYVERDLLEALLSNTEHERFSLG
jgi:hypothetical protein